ncbi:unnamed protein product [Dibothriocephalus latus]|uniref:Uncharacterized protein n=1 Tax=Dibothriocephalus latus TaxID=60516 RepID=A0A3P7RTG3_DIBLA|nr:unnamed protein product [Dibothriocephalus latus]
MPASQAAGKVNCCIKVLNALVETSWGCAKETLGTKLKVLAKPHLTYLPINPLNVEACALPVAPHNALLCQQFWWTCSQPGLRNNYCCHAPDPHRSVCLSIRVFYKEAVVSCL